MWVNKILHSLWLPWKYLQYKESLDLTYLVELHFAPTRTFWRGKKLSQRDPRYWLFLFGTQALDVHCLEQGIKPALTDTAQEHATVMMSSMPFSFPKFVTYAKFICITGVFGPTVLFWWGSTTLHPVAGISKYHKVITLFSLFFELGVDGTGKTTT